MWNWLNGFRIQQASDLWAYVQSHKDNQKYRMSRIICINCRSFKNYDANGETGVLQRHILAAQILVQHYNELELPVKAAKVT